jgi:hypothetical protein
MLKLLTCVLVIFGLCLATLLLRQQRQWIGYQLNQVHSKIERTEGELWTQQVQIAQVTAPRQLVETAANKNVPMSGVRSYPAARKSFEAGPATRPGPASADSR